MISVKRALSIIKNNANIILETEIIQSRLSLGRVLAESIRSNNNNPSFNMSAMDGYAVRNNPKNSIYNVVAETFAGKPSKKKIFDNEAIRVFTGSKLPDGTKAVIIQENIKKLENNLIYNTSKKISLGKYIRKIGQDFRKNQKIISKNKRINSRDIALLLAADVKTVKVYKKPKISLLATGDELTVSNGYKKEGSVFASSLFMLESLIYLAGATCNYKKIVKDNKFQIKDELIKASKSDIILTTGGVSVGKKDLIKSSLEELKFQEKFWKIKMKPGKPLLFGILNKKPIFSLPGNPVSSYVCFMIFIIPFLYKMLNQKHLVNSKYAILDRSVIPSNDRDSFYRGFHYTRQNKAYVKVLYDQDSSLLKTLSNSNCLVEIPKKKSEIKKNASVKIILIPELY